MFVFARKPPFMSFKAEIETALEPAVRFSFNAGLNAVPEPIVLA